LRLVQPEPGSRQKAAAHVRASLILLLTPAAGLTMIGLVMVLSASSVTAYAESGSSFMFFNRQVIYAFVGVAGLIAVARAPYRMWQRLSVPLLAITVVLLILALTAGRAAYGASRWLYIGPVSLQPSELAKLSLLAFTATVLAAKWRRREDLAHVVVPIVPVTAVVALIVVLQRDLGTTIVLCGSVFLLLFVAGVRLRWLAAGGAIGLLLSIALILGEGYRRDRLFAYANPGADPGGAGYQLIQGYIALGSGGWFGVGLGASRQKWGSVPNAHTDFIFAILGEELGLVGEFVVLALFGLLIYAGIRIAVRAPDTFGRLLAAAITGWFGLQAIVNLGAVTGLMPITGVPLPFVSFGGSALVVTLVAVGVQASIARASAGGRTRSRSRPAASS
ncbi:MAG: putative lipid II flippase FtsW, partial [Actinomycetota bacterium]|nr:putative lipid II flippase FtsW [Actinomycetota bacterium]